MICAGIDAGSRTIKAVLLDVQNLEVVGSGVLDQGVEQDLLARQLLQSVLQEHGFRRDDLQFLVATGYGRKLIRDADATITEITCQAAGIAHSVPGVRTVIDIGGQDSKLLRLGSDGGVTDFVMNDRCAAGTGRFLEVVATRLGVRLVRLGEMASRSQSPANISSMCVVFAETEIVGLLSSGNYSRRYCGGCSSIDRGAGDRDGRPAHHGARRFHRWRGDGPRHGHGAACRTGRKRQRGRQSAIDLRPGRGDSGSEATPIIV